MRLLIVAVALVGLAAAAEAGNEWQCKEESGCDARITVDGEIQVVHHRKNDIVSEEAGWVISVDDGWEKVKTRDQSPNAPARPSAPAATTFVVDDRMAGTTLAVSGLFSRTYVGRQGFTTGSGAGGTTGDTYEMTWKHDSDGPGGSYQPQTVTVRCEKNPGETTREHANRFKRMVEEMRDIFPPNVPE